MDHVREKRFQEGIWDNAIFVSQEIEQLCQEGRYEMRIGRFLYDRVSQQVIEGGSSRLMQYFSVWFLLGKDSLKVR